MKSKKEIMGPSYSKLRSERWLHRQYKALNRVFQAYPYIQLIRTNAITNLPLYLMNKFYANYYLRKSYIDFDNDSDLFTAIQIQTQTRCNYNCSFCPNMKVERPHGKMDEGLYVKILKNLADLNFSGIISPYLMNEPLLDNRIVKFISLARKYCPNALVRIQTNGSLLTYSLLKQILDLGSIVSINDYTTNHRIIEETIKWDLNDYEWTKLRLNKRSDSEILTNRANNVSGWKISLPRTLPLKIFCELPFKQMYIGFNGKALLCCQDWRFEEIMGDVTENRLEEIWRNKKYISIRKRLLNNDRRDYLCKRCDYRA